MPEWITPNQAAERDDCPVTGHTLREMIKRGDIPEDCYMVVPYGETRKTYYIDANCLADLDYNPQGREQGYNK